MNGTMVQGVPLGWLVNIGPSAPTSGIVVGSVWSDTLGNAVKHCTSLSPITFVTDLAAAGVTASDSVAALAASAAAGSSATYSRGDHVHGAYAALNGAARTTNGVDATDDLIVDLATKGLVLKDTQGTPHYWRLDVTVAGVVTTADLGTSKP